MSENRILVAGVGNVFFGDDGFGTEVAARLAQRELPEKVRVVDFGIRGYDLAYALTGGYETAILVDATPRGGRPGSLYVIEPEFVESGAASLDAHSMDLGNVLRFAQTLGSPLPKLLVVGCEPQTVNADDLQMGLSQPVTAAINDAVDLIESMVTRLLTTTNVTPASESEPRMESP